MVRTGQWVVRLVQLVQVGRMVQQFTIASGLVWDGQGQLKCINHMMRFALKTTPGHSTVAIRAA